MAAITNKPFLDGVVKRFAQMGIDWLGLIYTQQGVSTIPHSKEAKVLQKVLNAQIEKMKMTDLEVAHYTKLLMLAEQVLIPIVDSDTFYQSQMREVIMDLAREARTL